MKFICRSVLVLTCLLFLFMLSAYSPSETFAAKAEKSPKVAKTEMETWSKPNAAFDASKMGDMSGWDPANWVNPEGDVIKIAVTWPHSGPGAGNGELAWACVTFVAYDINQRGGIFVDGKKRRLPC